MKKVYEMLATVCLNRSLGERDGGHCVRKADTNIFSVKFKTLAESSSVHTGDAVVCKNTQCSAVLSHPSNLTKMLDEEVIVNCT